LDPGREGRLVDCAQGADWQRHPLRDLVLVAGDHAEPGEVLERGRDAAFLEAR
jgi:hypothetical protein